MIRHRHIERICALAMVLALALTGLLFFGERLGMQAASAAPEYAARLFDGSRVHTVDIQVGDWAQFLADAPEEAREYGDALKAECGFKDVFYTHIGPIIGAHTGPGLISVFFVGKERV